MLRSSPKLFTFQYRKSDFIQAKVLNRFKTLQRSSNSIMNSSNFIGCYISSKLLERIEVFMEENGFSTKSELIRSALRKQVNDGCG